MHIIKSSLSNHTRMQDMIREHTLANIASTPVSSELRNGMMYNVEMWKYNPTEEPTEMHSAYTIEGDYIGDWEEADDLHDRGIVPELASEDHCVCSIGFCAVEAKWFGWSHRAMFGFGVGDDVYVNEQYEGDTEKNKITTLEQAKKCAIDFAESVS